MITFIFVHYLLWKAILPHSIRFDRNQHHALLPSLKPSIFIALLSGLQKSESNDSTRPPLCSKFLIGEQTELSIRMINCRLPNRNSLIWLVKHPKCVHADAVEPSSALTYQNVTKEICTGTFQAMYYRYLRSHRNELYTQKWLELEPV